MKSFPEIPGYVIKKKLGRGGMADVYLAVQENLSRLVAIKVFHAERFDTPRRLRRFLKEAQIASRLIHPHIVTIYDVGKSGELHFMVMEYLPETLKERIRKRGRLPAEEALDILLRIGSALFYAHGKGFIHRDVKSDNIMFRKDGTPVVVDFGIARAVETHTRLTATGVTLGTPHYMSPEQCRGRRLDGRSDIYSLGVVLYEMLTGSLPFPGPDLRRIMFQHIQDGSPRLVWSLRRFQPVVDSLLAKEKGKRPRSESELRQLVKPLLGPFSIDTASAAEMRKAKKVRTDEKTRTSFARLTPESKKTEDTAKHKQSLGWRKIRRYALLFIALLVAMLVFWVTLRRVDLLGWLGFW